MRVNWRRETERLQHVHLARGVVQVVVATDDMGDIHVHVVHHDGEVVGRRAVGARNYKIVEFDVLEHHAPADQVLHHHRPVERILEAHHRRHSRRRIRHAVAALAVVTRLFLARHLLRAQLLQAFLGAITTIGLALVQHLLDDFLVAREAMGLEERPFVILQAEPGHALQNGIHRLGGGTLEVGVLDAQNERAPVLARVEPGKQRGARAAHVQVTGGAGGESGADGHFGMCRLESRYVNEKPAAAHPIRQSSSQRP